MDNYLFIIESAYKSYYPENYKEGHVQREITNKQDTLRIGTLVILTIILIVSMTLSSSTMSASCDRGFAMAAAFTGILTNAAIDSVDERVQLGESQ
jgi:hypothetical protein